MYELEAVKLDALLNLTTAIDWRPAPVEAIALAVMLYNPRPAVVNRNTMRLISPRADLDAIALIRQLGYTHPVMPNWNVPTLFGRWPEDDEPRAALAWAGGYEGTLLAMPTMKSLTPILLNQDVEKIGAIGLSVERYQDLLQEIAGEAPPRPPAPPRTPLDNDLGIPMLALEMQAIRPPEELLKWGTQARNTTASGQTYHFYTSDEKFSALMNDNRQLIASGVASIIEPNITILDQTPKAISIFRLYQKRTFARKCQDAGIRVYVDMNIPKKLFDLALIGVPAGWTAYANRAYAGDLEHLDDAYHLARAHASREIIYVVYGGGQKARQMAASKGWYWYPDQMREING